ncbi:MAG: hypothetical protein H5T73_01405 [Actinobacteria bacterium]|nr:hypothetical protein [Actinomycetota bacterium]
MISLTGAIMLSCSSPCFADNIKPPTEEQAEDFIEKIRNGEGDMACFMTGEIMSDPPFKIVKTVKTTEIVKHDDGTVFVRYYLYVIYTTSTKAVVKDGMIVPLDESAADKILYNDVAFLESTSWVGGTDQPLEETGTGNTKSDSVEVEIPPDKYGSGMERAVSEMEATLEETLASYEHQSGWVEVGPGGDVVSTPGGESEREGEAGKIPGPGSWWKWLVGTVIAGIIAAVTGFLNSLLALPPVPVTPLAPPGKPASPPAAPPGMEPFPAGIAGGTAEPFSSQVDPYQQAPENVLVQTIRNIGDDVETVPGYLSDKAKWIWDGVTDVENLKDMMDKIKKTHENFEKWKKEQAEAAVEYFANSLKDPFKPVMDLEEAKKDATKYIAENIIIPVLQDPLGTLKTILGTELWKNAIDPNKPLPDRFAYSALATLNTIGLLEGISGLGRWLFGGGSRQAGKALISAGKDKLDDAARAAGLVDDKLDDLARVRKVKAKPGLFDKLGKAEKGRLKTIWASDLQKAESKIKRFKKAMKSGDVRIRTEAILEIQKDPLAIQKLNAKDRSVIRSFNKQLRDLQDKAMEDARRQIASEFGVSPDQVDVFRATNPKVPGAKAKAAMDQDITVRIKGADGKIRDVPADKVQKIYDESFYRAAGSPEGTTPAQLGRDCRNVAVDRHSAEAFGMSPDDWQDMQLGKGTSHTDTVSRTMQYKADEAFAEADRLARSGDMTSALKRRYLGQREIVKAFNNQVRGRVQYLERTNPGKAAAVSRKIADVEGTIDDMNRMINRGASPVEVDDFLRSRGTSAEELAKEVADIYRGLTP